MTIGVYGISLELTNKKMIYIGSSANIENRFSQHRYFLNHHMIDRVNIHLYNAWQKYGKENFTFNIIETINQYDKETLLKLEQKYIDKFKINNKIDRSQCFNLNANATSRKGTKVSKETKEKMRKIMIGNTRSLGEKHPKTKLKNEDVIEIKNLLNKTNITHIDLAKKYGVTKRVISNIASNQTWKKIGPPVERKTSSCRLFQEEQIKLMRKQYKEGRSAIEIAEEYKVNRTTISRIVNYHAYQDIKD